MKTLTPRYFVILICLLLVSAMADAQVRQIKSASRSRGGGGEGRSGGGTDVGLFIDVFYFSVQGIAQWQRMTLAKRDSIPSLFSFEGSLQTAMQPSSYYIVHPRIRGNWGLFSTDLRINYLIEESVEGPIHLRTTDWQIIQLNMITTPRVNFNVGFGMMYEAYGSRTAYPEITTAFTLRPGPARIGAFVEYRDAEARREVNGSVRYSFGTTGKFHWYASAGAAFQRYYSSINVWGIQGGLGFQLY